MPGFQDKNVILEIINSCSSDEVSVIGELYIGEDLDKDCLIGKYNQVFKQDSHKDWLNSVYEAEVEEYKPSPGFSSSYGSAPLIQNIQSITSIWGNSCGERCNPTSDLLYESGNKFWYLVPSEQSDMTILKVNEAGEPLLIHWVRYYSTGSANYLLHLPKNKSFFMGGGSFSIENLNLKVVEFNKSWIKSYFQGGGAFWYDAKISFNFDTEQETRMYVNVSTQNCMDKDDFLSSTGWIEDIEIVKQFDHIDDEVCYRL